MAASNTRRIIFDMGELTRDQLIQELQNSQAQVIQLLETVEPIQDWQPEPAEWSFRFIAAHLATVEQNCHLPRVISIASGDTPSLSLYTNRAADYEQTDMHKALKRWVATRRELLDFVASLSPHQFVFTGLHESLGPITILELLHEILRQDRGNLRHVRQLIVVYQEEHQPTCEAL